ncbi:Histone-lysine N-methyltransferase, H3 lysine-79 specific [Hondaea fermentalgiana]|uniref:Histone-lysine N-methyltransferase, H3 lysine-79 specific n=1 Tax=Hondaea fermentalgiana TaxID=2315210 RepID=A0A2R5GNS6_9STRA|nr:Histone-lysine N-methyltransferase, H3 lysine-79 specific [Hondaea fermentalgiana]|eukprot:GBG29524.1 Histone-lysine N-methyltransferase, H3 lysine-79 specific [Hondaea fermentalgiana]
MYASPSFELIEELTPKARERAAGMDTLAVVDISEEDVGPQHAQTRNSEQTNHVEVVQVSPPISPAEFKKTMREYPNEHDVYLSRRTRETHRCTEHKPLMIDDRGRFVYDNLVFQKTIYLSYYVEAGVTIIIHKSNAEGQPVPLFKDSVVESAEGVWRHYPLDVIEGAVLTLTFHQCYAYSFNMNVSNQDTSSCGPVQQVAFNTGYDFICVPEPFDVMKLELVASALEVSQSSSSSSSIFWSSLPVSSRVHEYTAYVEEDVNDVDDICPKGVLCRYEACNNHFAKMILRMAAGWIHRELLARGGTRKDSAEVTDEPTRDSNQAAIEALDEHIFANIDGYKVAAAVKRELREQKRYEETTALTYGEVRCSAFADLLRECAPTEKGTFADIGSGTGKAVLTAALCGFHDCLGIEIVDKLHACAEQGLDRAIREGLIAQDAQVKFVHGDSFALVDRWTQKDLIFAPTTCFTEDLMAQLTAALSALKPGARIITTTRTLTSKLLKLVLRKRFKYARGSLVFMVYERVAK